jgi:exodeoxyribonuclease III
MKIISYNVNGVRAAQNKGLAEWLKSENPDIIGFQEVKANEDQVDMTEIEALGYQHFWYSAEKKGYSGVAVLCKKKPDLVIRGIGHELFDFEGRVIRLDFGDLTILNCYFPSGSSGETRQDVKYVFLDYFYDWVNELRKSRPNLIIMGDYNIAHTEMDIHDPKSNKDSSGFLPEERAWMTKWLENGFTDAFRKANPSLKKYSWWSFRFNARANNKGWRIDYISLSEPIAHQLVSSDLLNDALHSDHCPVVVVMS